MGLKKTASIVLIVVLIILVGLGSYFAWSKKEKTEPVVSETLPIDTSNWKTYTDTQYGFEFKYPQNWVLGTYGFGGSIAEIAVDPEKVESQEAMRTLDIFPGLISFVVENSEDCPSCHVIGYESFDKVEIGEQSAIQARKSESINDGSNPYWEGTQEIDYFVDYGENKEHRLKIRYVSRVPNKDLEEFNQILSTLKFIK